MVSLEIFSPIYEAASIYLGSPIILMLFFGLGLFIFFILSNWDPLMALVISSAPFSMLAVQNVAGISQYVYAPIVLILAIVGTMAFARLFLR